MVPLPPAEARTVRAVGASRSAPGRPTTAEVVRTLREYAAGSAALVALVDADAVAGERHILSAWAHLGRSRSRGGARLRDRGAEFVLYLSGDDQLPRALAKVGVNDRTDRFVLVVERPLVPEEVLAKFGLTADPAAFPRPVTAGLLERLGISAAERDAVPASAWEGWSSSVSLWSTCRSPRRANPRRRNRTPVGRRAARRAAVNRD